MYTVHKELWFGETLQHVSVYLAYLCIKCNLSVKHEIRQANIHSTRTLQRGK